MGEICPHHGGPALAEISLSAVAIMFCTIPRYIQTFIRINVAAREYLSAVGGRGSFSAPPFWFWLQCTVPLVTSAALTDALNRVRAEFEFNISVSHHFSVNLNASKSLGEVSADIMEAVQQHMEPYHRALEFFSYISVLAILYLWYQ